jgi:HD-like signal output (HDOD) protein
MTTKAPPLDQFVDRAGALYSLPRVAMEVLDLTRHDHVDTAALRACIENDPALVSKLLRVVNSSLFGLSRKVSDLNQALALLGARPLKLLVLGFSLPEKLFAGLGADVLARYWRRTLTKAVAAREFAEIVWKRPGDDAFLAALLSDIGVLVLLRELGQPYVDFLDRVYEEEGDARALESNALGFDHSELSAALLKQWSLPEKLIQAVAIRGTTDRLVRLPEDQSEGPQILHLSELLAQVVAEHRTAALPELLNAARAYRDIGRKELVALVATLGEKVDALADVLSLELPDGQDYEQVLFDAHERMSILSERLIPELSQHPVAKESTPDELLAEVESLTQAAAEALRTTAYDLDAADQGDTNVSPAMSRPPVGAAQSSAAVLARPMVIDQGLQGRLARALATARVERVELSLLMVGLDDFESRYLTDGPNAAALVTQLLVVACNGLDHPGIQTSPIGEANLAVIVPNCDRREAVTVAGQLAGSIQSLAQRRLQRSAQPVSTSIGVATMARVPKNLAVQELADSASRCLYAAQASGGGMVKSIEL